MFETCTEALSLGPFRFGSISCLLSCLWGGSQEIKHNPSRWPSQTFTLISDYPPHQRFSTGGRLCTQMSGESRDIFGFHNVGAGGLGYEQHLVGRDQRCCGVPYNARAAPITKTPLTQNVENTVPYYSLPPNSSIHYSKHFALGLHP